MGDVTAGMSYQPVDPAFVGPYRILNRLGEGGMGVVYLALDPAGRAVALKLLGPAAGADPQARRRLAREVETLLLVRHPNVAAVLDAELRSDRPYVVTAFVPGRTLEQYVEAEGALPPDQVARLGRTLADALRAIHAVGVVHRDLKPANVMMLDGEPVIIDFGIARLVDDTRLTVTGLVMGTPGYLSPEVVDGHPVTPATDWWGWGVLLAYAATGRPPFGSGGTAAVLDRVRRGACDLSGVDPRLAGVLAGALVVDPGRRPPAEVLLAGLSQPWVAPPAPTTTGPPAPSASGTPASFAAGTPFGRPLFGSSVQPARPQPAQAVQPAQPAQPVQHRAVDPAARTVVTAPPPTFDPQARTLPGAPGRSVPYTALDAVAPAPSAPPSPLPSAPPGSSPGTSPIPSPGTEPGLVGGTLVFGLVTVAALAAVTPGLAVLVCLLCLVAARVTDASVTGLLRRRYQRGTRPGDAASVVAAIPWRIAVASVITLASAVIPVLLAGSTAFLLAAAANPGAPRPSAAAPLAAGMAAGWVAAWWGPGGSSVRRGTRIATRALVARRPGHVGVLVLLGFVLVACLLVANSGAAPDWHPFTWHPGGP